ncbi:MAG: aromatic amino acid transporter [Flavobacteriaceae bacterium]|jgi:tyrosine-specific transport protein|nr:aromatic amino acid transporter [Flavobacteriaceae bacterium]
MKSKLLGSILIIAGSSIGGGMLAMPITSAGIGFIGSSILLFSIWFAMCYTALLMVKIYDYNDKEAGFDTLTRKYAGYALNRIAGASLMFLIYGLTAAYMTGGGTILQEILSKSFTVAIDTRICILLFSIVFSGIVIFSTQMVDWFTRVLFIAKLIFFVLLIALLIPLVDGQNLLSMPLSKGLILTAIPAVFTSFGFHGSIPSIVNYLDGKKKLLKQAFVLGSLLPLVIYLIWQVMVLGSLDQTLFMSILQENLGLKGLIMSIREISTDSHVENLFSLFAAAALGTSYLGVSIGLFDYYQDLFRNKNKKNIKFWSGISTFIPPLLFALFYPQGFTIALGYAAIAGVILALIIPTVLYIKAMKVHEQTISIVEKLIIAFIFLLAMVIVIAQFYTVTN